MNNLCCGLNFFLVPVLFSCERHHEMLLSLLCIYSVKCIENNSHSDNDDDNADVNTPMQGRSYRIKDDHMYYLL